MIVMGILSHQGECKTNTSGLGVLRCSLQGREVIILRPVWPISTWHSWLSTRLSRPPRLCFQGRGKLPLLVCLFLVLVPGA